MPAQAQAAHQARPAPLDDFMERQSSAESTLTEVGFAVEAAGPPTPDHHSARRSVPGSAVWDASVESPLAYTLQASDARL